MGTDGQVVRIDVDSIAPDRFELDAADQGKTASAGVGERRTSTEVKHETILLYLAGGTGPYNREISPLTVSEWQALANYELARLSGLGLGGVWTWGFYTGWYPGYLLWTTNNHNSLGRFYETFGNGSSETMMAARLFFSASRMRARAWRRTMPRPVVYAS